MSYRYLGRSRGSCSRRWLVILGTLSPFVGLGSAAAFESRRPTRIVTGRSWSGSWPSWSATPRRGTALDRVYGYHVERGSSTRSVRSYRDRAAKDPDDGAGLADDRPDRVAAGPGLGGRRGVPGGRAAPARRPPASLLSGPGPRPGRPARRRRPRRSSGPWPASRPGPTCSKSSRPSAGSTSEPEERPGRRSLGPARGPLPRRPQGQGAGRLEPWPRRRSSGPALARYEALAKSARDPYGGSSTGPRRPTSRSSSAARPTPSATMKRCCEAQPRELAGSEESRNRRDRDSRRRRCRDSRGSRSTY